ncbi:MAG: YggS family pyridoxal phosphate-dependent enzyme [Desulfobacteraceae bacterium]|nr:YggS family pyridoxal phosphate-dependent enzyme [Desulfobacteraceae bacterium]
MSSIAENLGIIRARIDDACRRVGRDPSEVRLVGVTKTVPASRIREGVQAGIAILGENYIQEARTKVEALGDLEVSWHFIGHLQSNKAKIAVECCDMVHTVDRESLALELDRQAKRAGRVVPVLIQVNVGDEATKSGTSPEALPGLFRVVSGLEGLAVRGLMALPPYEEDPESARPYFRMLRELLEGLKRDAPKPGDLRELSMGMSHDFEVAVEEGATLVRIGTALFGERAPRNPA